MHVYRRGNTSDFLAHAMLSMQGGGGEEAASSRLRGAGGVSDALHTAQDALPPNTQVLTWIPEAASDSEAIIS